MGNKNAGAVHNPEGNETVFLPPLRAEYERMLRRVIAVDFDGCLCANAYPEIGEENVEVIEKLKQEQRGGAAVILWTNRTGALLEDAVAWCADKGIYFDGINESLVERVEFFGSDPRKIGADEYWDDRAVRMPPEPLDAGQEILRRALHKYGVDAQVGKCVEEMSELIKALLKERLAAGLERPAARNAIFEEIADVYIMLEQMRMAFEISGMEVDEWATLKIARLEKRLNGEG